MLLKNRLVKYAADAGSNDRAFIHPSTHTPVTFAQGDDKPATLLPGTKCLSYSDWSKITTGVHLDSQASSLGQGIVALIDDFTSLTHYSSGLLPTTDCWRPVQISRISKPTVYPSIVRSIALMSYLFLNWQSRLFSV